MAIEAKKHSLKSSGVLKATNARVSNNIAANQITNEKINVLNSTFKPNVRLKPVFRFANIHSRDPEWKT